MDTVAADPFDSEPKKPLTAVLRQNPDTTHIHPATGRRWALVGIKSWAGQIVKLRVKRIGSRMLTSPEALVRFLNELNGEPVLSVPAPRSPSYRQRESTEAGKRLEQLGC